MARTLTQIRDFARLYYELDVNDLPDSLIDAWALEAQRRIWRYKKSWPKTEKVGTLTTEAGVAEYALPTGFREVTSLIHPDNGPMIEMGEAAAERGFFSSNPTTSKPGAWSVYANKLTLYPTPDAAYALLLRGVASYAAVGASSAAPELPSEDLDESLLSWVMYRVHQHQDDMPRAEAAKRDADDLLREIAADESSTTTSGPLIMNAGPPRITNLTYPDETRYRWNI